MMMQARFWVFSPTLLYTHNITCMLYVVAVVTFYGELVGR